jgi:putative heme iron utilization protein
MSGQHFNKIEQTPAAGYCSSCIVPAFVSPTPRDGSRRPNHPIREERAFGTFYLSHTASGDPEMSLPPTPVPSSFDAPGHAKRLLRITRTGALATLDPGSGAPLTTLVSVGSDYDGAPLLLLSALAQHTRNLAQDARGSLLLASQSGRGDPLNQPRLTIGGEIVAHPAPRARARFLARNPKSKLYASFGDFAMFRMEISMVHFNGGFARAAALTPTDILTDLANADALIEAEATLLEEANGLGAARLTQLAGDAREQARRRWRAIGLDPEGLDLIAGAHAARASFEALASTPQAWRAALDALCDRRRAGA